MPREAGNVASTERHDDGRWVAVIYFRGEPEKFGVFTTEAEAMKAAEERLGQLEKEQHR